MKYKWYNTKDLGVIGINEKDIHHEDGDYTFLTIGTKGKWILTSDIKNSYDEAKNSGFALFL